MKASLVRGDVVRVLRRLPKNYARTCITSPPYWGQRDYDSSEQIGAEKTPVEYIDKIVRVMRGVRKVLTEDGTLWLNLGDKYKDGQLQLIPERVAIAMIDDGWRLLSEIIWHKPNVMPESVKTRPTRDHEHLFLFAKGKKHFYDCDAIREPHKWAHDRRNDGGRHAYKSGSKNADGKGRKDACVSFHPLGRNKRTVWSVPTSRIKQAHFAPFPEALVEPCVKAGSERGDIVLDPFNGAGTTGLVAMRLDRHYIGIDVNREYLELTVDRWRDKGLEWEPRRILQETENARRLWNGLMHMYSKPRPLHLHVRGLQEQ